MGDRARRDTTALSCGVELRRRRDRLAEGGEIVAGGGRDLREQARLGHPRLGVDLEDVLVLAFGHEKIDPHRARATERARSPLGEVEHATEARRRDARRHEIVGRAGGVLRGVVVHPALRRDLAASEDAAIENTDRDLAATDEALDERDLVERERALDGAPELAHPARLFDPQARALRARLHDDGKSEATVGLLEVGEVVARADGVVRRGRHVVEAEELLRLDLVHRERAREHARPRVRDAMELADALDAAVLSEPSVKREKRDVDPRALELLGRVAVADDDVDHLVAARAKRLCDRPPRAQADVALSR